MKVLVTGATSLLGRVTVERLLADGHDVTVLQRRPAGLPCREVLADIADADAAWECVNGAQALPAAGLRVQMRKCALTGSDAATAAALAQELGVSHRPDGVVVAGPPVGTPAFIAATVAAPRPLLHKSMLPCAPQSARNRAGCCYAFL